MSAPRQALPRWVRALLRRLAPPSRVDDVLGDMEEAHRARLDRHTRPWAETLTGLEALDMAVALLRDRRPRGSTSLDTGRRSGFPWVTRLDLKLALRMLVRYPGLTVVGGVSLAFGIWIGTVSFEFATQVISPTLPVEEGERVVGIQQLQSREGTRINPTLADFRRWSESLESVGELGAFRLLARNLEVEGGVGAPESVAEMTASGFRIAGASALLGRTLDPADERAGAAPVVVIGYDLWRERFDRDPDVLSATLRLGGVPTTVVGVMPEGFGFPIAHELWTPLRPGAPEYAEGEGPRLQVFGRLAEGVSLREAQAELDAVGARWAAELPETHGELLPRAVPYVESVQPEFRLDPAGAWALGVFMAMLLLIICGDVGLLLFARVLTREGEIMVRNALGAGRARIVGQLFAEALVLGAVAAAAGLAFAGPGLSRMMETLRIDMELEAMPIWFSSEPAFRTMIYGLVVAIAAAVVAGALPALRITGRGFAGRLRQASAGGGGFRLGGVWTAVIVAQVAVTVAVPPCAFVFFRYLDHQRSLDIGFDADAWVTARLELDTTAAGAGTLDTARAAVTLGELERRLESDPVVAGVTFTQAVPGRFHPQGYYEVEGEQPGSNGLVRVGATDVEVDFFETLGIAPLAGRGFRAGDLEGSREAVVVNASFVEHMLGGRNAVGRRLRRLASGAGERGPWLEIVGVFPDLGAVAGDFDPRDDPGLYRPAAPEAIRPTHLLVHVPAAVATFSPALRGAAADVDPALRLYEPMTLRADLATGQAVRITEFMFQLFALGCVVALLLALSGIYSVMSYTVSRRTREIGVRVALGAEPIRLVLSILWRPVARVAIGVALGGVLAVVLSRGLLDDSFSRGETLVVAGYAAAMMGVCMLASIVPTRRALAVEPTEALRAEG